MTFVVIFVVTAAVSLLLRNPLREWPWLFYLLAIAADVLFIAASFMPLPHSVWSLMLLLVQRCLLPLALFAVVMFVGVFASDSKVRAWFRPIRAELSIIAWILSLGHMSVYLVSYAPRMLTGGSLAGNVAFSFFIALVLFALLLVLGITSFDVVKRRMKADTWKRVQSLAYPFFGLVYVHLLLMLVPAAARGGVAAQTSVGVYTAVFGVYALLRGVRAVKDRKTASPMAPPVKPQKIS